jgi:hypothetical protein
MASADTDIVNLALFTLGEPAILSMTDDNDVARAANGIFDEARDFVLSEHPWNRCVKAVVLTRTARTPLDDQYTYEYLYPSDALRILGPITSQDRQKWETGASSSTNEAVIWSTESAFTVKYIFRNQVVSLYSPGLVEAMAAYVAMKLALALTGHRGKFQDMQQLYIGTLSRSKGLDGQEQSPVEFVCTTLTDDVRLGG